MAITVSLQDAYPARSWIESFHSSPKLFITIVFLFGFYLIRWLRTPGLPVDLRTGKTSPIVGGPKSLPWLFPDLRSRFLSFLRVQAWINEGYEKYGRKGKAYTVRTWQGDI